MPMAVTEYWRYHCYFPFFLSLVLFSPADKTQKEERRTRENNVSGHYKVWVRIPGWPTKITNSFSDETLKQSPVWRWYTPSTLKNQAEFSVVSSCIPALSPVTTNRLLGGVALMGNR